jgi:Family of unknown function (DUF6262)
MTRTDNTRFLVQATADRHQATLKRAGDAIAHLESTRQPVNFSAVAAAAGVSRASLYREPAIRDLISRMRSAPPSRTTRAAQRATAESLRTLLDTARAENTRLRAENTALREEAARHLGQQRAQPAPPPMKRNRARPEPHVSDMSPTQKPRTTRTSSKPT